ncbi:unnamed protein product [Caenorhabditis auriculariae]|uniref:KIX domain-containing protein n=1 Tax=Caenorhabditis auriculariae TaxID=2777116 RepID=A0A8S1GS44_9PELO|nr:unnamed protein product [Caenorhabditis auriculariae]
MVTAIDTTEPDDPELPEMANSAHPTEGEPIAADDIDDISTPLNTEIVKDWHTGCCKDLRSYLMGKLVKTSVQLDNIESVRDPRVRPILVHARQAEKDFFETANDREEYYHMIAVKCYMITKEIQERRNLN